MRTFTFSVKYIVTFQMESCKDISLILLDIIKWLFFLVGVIRYICDMPLVIVVAWFFFLL